MHMKIIFFHRFFEISKNMQGIQNIHVERHIPNTVLIIFDLVYEIVFALDYPYNFSKLQHNCLVFVACL